MAEGNGATSHSKGAGAGLEVRRPKLSPVCGSCFQFSPSVFKHISELWRVALLEGFLWAFERKKYIFIQLNRY
jgi:hypothetical protein